MTNKLQVRDLECNIAPEGEFLTHLMDVLSLKMSLGLSTSIDYPTKLYVGSELYKEILETTVVRTQRPIRPTQPIIPYATTTRPSPATIFGLRIHVVDLLVGRGYILR